MLLHSFIHSTSTFVELPQALRIDTVPDFQGLPGSLLWPHAFIASFRHVLAECIRFP